MHLAHNHQLCIGHVFRGCINFLRVYSNETNGGIGVLIVYDPFSYFSYVYVNVSLCLKKQVFQLRLTYSNIYIILDLHRY